MIDIDLLVASMLKCTSADWKIALVKALGEQNIHYSSKMCELIKDLPKISPEFKVGDWVMYYGIPCKIEEINVDGLRIITYRLVDRRDNVKNRTANTNEFRKWTLDDADIGDTLCVTNEDGEYLVKYAGITNKHCIKAFTYYYVDGDELQPTYSPFFNITDSEIRPATVEEETIFMDALSERDMEWNILRKCVMMAIR